MEFSDNQDRIFVFRLLFCIFIIVKAIKVRFMGDIIIVLLVFWVVFHASQFLPGQSHLLFSQRFTAK